VNGNEYEYEYGYGYVNGDVNGDGYVNEDGDVNGNGKGVGAWKAAATDPTRDHPARWRPG
jgi:hypothetical protein